MTQVPDAASMKAFNAQIADEFRANAGKVGGPFAGRRPASAHHHRRQVR